MLFFFFFLSFLETDVKPKSSSLGGSGLGSSSASSSAPNAKDDLVLTASGADANAGLRRVSQRTGRPIDAFTVIDDGLTEHLSLCPPSLGEEVRASVWNTRGWTFQEVVASQDVMVLHDRFAMKLDSLTRFWKSLVTLVNGTVQDLIQDGADGDMAILEAITIINRLPIDALQPRKAQVKMPTFDSTRFTEEFIRDRACENPRDIVFSALALFPSEIQKDIQVDYALPVEEVYANITRSMMQHEGPFPLLNKVDEFGHYKTSSATPTWIPDYDYRHREYLSLRFQRTVLELPKMDDDASSQEGQGIEPKAQPEMQTMPLRSEHSIVATTSKTDITFANQGKVLQLPAILIGNFREIANPKPALSLVLAQVDVL